MPVSSLFEGLEVLHHVPGANIDALEDVHLVWAEPRVLGAVSHDIDHDVVVHFLDEKKNCNNNFQS